MNQQEIFDKVATHLIAQGKQSLGSGPAFSGAMCAYRGDIGTMCAAGCLIPDDEYKAVFEGMPWDLVGKKIPSLANLTRQKHELINSLQECHDESANWGSPETLKESLRAVANLYDLSSDVLK